MKFLEKFLTHFPLYIIAFFIACLGFWLSLIISDSNGFNLSTIFIVCIICSGSIYFIKSVLKLINKIEDGAE